MVVTADPALLDDILRRTLDTIKDSQSQISAIAEEARTEVSRLRRELETVKRETLAVLDEVDAARVEEQRSRQELVRVSRDFSSFSEEDIRRAYERARDIQVRLALLTEKEKVLRARRDELERSLRAVTRLLERSETLSTQISVVVQYLDGNIEQLSQTLESVQEKRAIAVRIIRAQEEERRRVARDLHDGLAQQLASALLELQVTQRLLGDDTEKARQELATVEGIIRAGLRETRDVIFNLRPPSLDDLGLKAAVDHLAARIQERTGLEVEVLVHGEEQRLDGTVLTCVFRIIQEALNNVVKHAKATLAKVGIEFTPALLSVRVVDNGCGFETSANKISKTDAEHLGLLGMRERASLIGGSLEVKSSPGRGTRVVLNIPLAGPGTKGADENQ